ncbi:glycosyltransferase [Acuticoccus sp. MNP-M23]|uniref:glycosyltransferase n=1 Tax=Acuticoccus sp. MNP-M23 TaxID=3072793 RepID=UPI0028168E1D|nr:glycosyltransferase [Acuticoccus sp. MNP-M23]WMS44536.1 glycosyltransferase [Acuticoccus sp. MNP-M23]
MPRSVAFFVHHQGRGHARRCEAILEHLGDRPITVISAAREIFGTFDDRVRFVHLQNAIGDPSATKALHAQQTPDAMQCVPMGSRRLKQNAEAIVEVFRRDNPGLFVSDVSVEWALLARLCAVPCVKIRMHGDRSDASHIAAYQACAGMIAPFDARIEQADYPGWARAKTFYSGGLCTTRDPVPTKAEARKRLNLPAEGQRILVLSGAGGTGANYAALTMAARALPEAQWATIGPVHLEGHETEFANLTRLGWVESTVDHIAAADLVVASAGDNTVHEIARVGRPFLCIPEWRYYDEQRAKAAELERIGAATVLPGWPASNDQWRAAIASTLERGAKALTSLFEPHAAERIAQHLVSLDERLWGTADAAPAKRLDPRSLMPVEAVAKTAG